MRIHACQHMKYTYSHICDIRKEALAVAVAEFREYTPKCLAGEDLAFIDKYVSQGFGVWKPANGERIFGMKSVPERGESLQKTT